MAHIGEVGKKVELEVVYKRSITVYNPYCSAYNYADNYIHVFEDLNGNVIIWKTASVLGIDSDDIRGNLYKKYIPVNSKLYIKATVKSHSNYKGTDQTVVTRCKYEVVELAMSKEERDALKAEQQVLSLNEGDFIWREMPYKQYKEHYSDCETVAGSYKYDEHNGKSYIDVIIRNGRLKNSGVRGQIYFWVTFKLSNGALRSYKAVSERTARNQLKNDYPGEEVSAEVYKMEPYSMYKEWC